MKQWPNWHLRTEQLVNLGRWPSYRGSQHRRFYCIKILTYRIAWETRFCFLHPGYYNEILLLATIHNILFLEHNNTHKFAEIYWYQRTDQKLSDQKEMQEMSDTLFSTKKNLLTSPPPPPNSTPTFIIMKLSDHPLHITNFLPVDYFWSVPKQNMSRNDITLSW